MVRIQILYDNTSTNSDLEADWGFAALIVAYDKTVLFDTGGNGEILLKNMQVLQVDPKKISDVFISHDHFDHIGGLSHFLNMNKAITLHAPSSFRGVMHAREVCNYSEPQEIFPHFYTTGELEGIEQALAVETGKGLIIVAGCSHPAMDKILKAAAQFGKIHGIVGGLHGFDQYDLFEELQLICPTHCTQHIKEIKERFPGKYIEGGVGKVISVPSK